MVREFMVRKVYGTNDLHPQS